MSQLVDDYASAVVSRAIYLFRKSKSGFAFLESYAPFFALGRREPHNCSDQQILYVVNLVLNFYTTKSWRNSQSPRQVLSCRPGRAIQLRLRGGSVGMQPRPPCTETAAHRWRAERPAPLLGCVSSNAMHTCAGPGGSGRGQRRALPHLRYACILARAWATLGGRVAARFRPRKFTLPLPLSKPARTAQPLPRSVQPPPGMQVMRTWHTT